MTRSTLFSVLALATVGACSGEGETIGPRGGSIVSDDGRFSLEVPAGALSHDVTITIDEVDCAGMALAHAVGTCYQLGPRGTGFLYPATVTYELDESLDGVRPESLALSVRRNSGWNLLADRVVDRDEGILQASAGYLSAFAIVEMPDDGADGPATGPTRE